MEAVELSAKLVVWGPLGVLALVAITAAVKLYRDREKERKEHAQEMRTLEERYIAKAETWMEKYQDFSKATTQVVDAAMRRYRRDSGGDHGRQDQG